MEDPEQHKIMLHFFHRLKILQPTDEDFADDLALLSHRHAQLQDKTTCLETTSDRTGLHI